MCAYDDLVVIAGWGFVPATSIYYSDKASVITLHIAIGKAQLPHQFHTPDFKPDEVIGMIDHAHLIGLSVAHPQPAFASRGLVIASIVHLPLHRGLRFSRDAVIPSRKSAVARIRALSSIA